MSEITTSEASSVELSTSVTPEAATAADAAHTPSAVETPSTPETPAAFEIKEGTTFDEMLSNLPEDRLSSITSREINAASAAAEKGDLQAVAEIFGFKKPEAAKPKEEPKADPEPEPEEKGIDRISLRRLSTKDQKMVASITKAVTDGEYASIAEALAAMAPKSDAVAKVLETEPEAPVVPAEIKALEDRIAQIRADKKAATKSYDHEKADELTVELIEARFKLLQLKQEHAQAETANQSFAQTEDANIALVETQYAEQIKNPDFRQALIDAQDLAMHRNDPRLKYPDWPTKLAEDVAARFKALAPAKFPTAPAPTKTVRGLTETPGHQGTSMLTVNEALAKADGMDEEGIDRLIAKVRQIEAAQARR